MSHSLETDNYKLPLFADNDVPSWLGDFNGAMQTMDTSMKGVADSNTNISAQVIAFSNRLEVDEGKITANEQAVKDNAAAMQELTEQVATKAPVNHANANNIYGVGSGELYGHVKLSDTVNEQGATDGIAATPKAVNDVKATVAEIDQGLDTAETNIQTLQNWQNSTNSTLANINAKDQAQDTSISSLQSQINGLGTGAQISPDDYVVAQGHSGAWDFIKFNSGLAICSINTTTTVTSAQSWGVLHDYKAALAAAYPFAFISEPSEVGCASFVNNVAMTSIASNTDAFKLSQTKEYTAVRTASQVNTGTAIHFSVLVVGRWK